MKSILTFAKSNYVFAAAYTFDYSGNSGNKLKYATE